MTNYQLSGKAGSGRGRWEVGMAVKINAGILVLMRLLYLDCGGGYISCRNANNLKRTYAQISTSEIPHNVCIQTL